jgi:membrane protein implicated in regulation of membrane protease activity
MPVIDQVFWASAIVGVAAVAVAALVGVVGHAFLDTGSGHDAGAVDAGAAGHALPGDVGGVDAGAGGFHAGDAGGADVGGFEAGDAGAVHGDAGAVDAGAGDAGGAHGGAGADGGGDQAIVHGAHWSSAGQLILGYVNPTAIAMSLAFFGAMGLVLRGFAMMPVPAALIAFVTGVTLARLTTRTVGRLMASGSRSSHTSMRELVGRTAEVTTSIPEGGVGQVAIGVGGVRVYYPARADKAVAYGERVFVERIVEGVAIVSSFGD